MGTLTDVPGLLVGQAENNEHLTGATVVLCPQGAAAGMFVAGFAVGSHETELLGPLARVEEVHAVALCGGSAFGLAAVPGVMRFLAEQGAGLETPFGAVPLVPAAVIYDLNFNQSRGQPDADLGYQAASAASNAPVAQGCVGAGAGASCGKLAGFDRAMKSGVGSFSVSVGDLIVGAVSVVNPVGDVLDPGTGRILAGVRTPDGQGLSGADMALWEAADLIPSRSPSNTVISVVGVNAPLDKVQASRVARMAASGMGRALRPAHTLYDGDVVFVLSTGKGPVFDENLIGALAADVLAGAIANGAKTATSVPGFPACGDMVQA
jgi:L-aminopeptidase/D-esterase-like protein